MVVVVVVKKKKGQFLLCSASNKGGHLRTKNDDRVENEQHYIQFEECMDKVTDNRSIVLLKAFFQLGNHISVLEAET